MKQQLSLTGSQFGICLMAVTWLESCPFEKTAKPADVSTEELGSLLEYLSAVLSRFRQLSGFAEPLHEFQRQIAFEASEQERVCLIRCIEAVLEECEGSPVELELRVGDPVAVRQTARYLRDCTLAVPVLLDRGEPTHDRLSAVCADLLSYKRFEPFLFKLFESPPGSWITVAECCVALTELPTGAAELLSVHRETLLVAHAPWPASDSDGYSLIQFVHTRELWSTIAQYNRKLLFAMRSWKTDNGSEERAAS